MVSGLLQGTLGLLGTPGHIFPHCGPLVMAPILVVAGLSAHREVALFCSTHWGLALLYVSPEWRGWWPVGCVGLGASTVAGSPGLSSYLSRDSALWIWNPTLLLDLFGLPDFHTASC